MASVLNIDAQLAIRALDLGALMFAAVAASAPSAVNVRLVRCKYKVRPLIEKLRKQIFGAHAHFSRLKL